jgi:membrane-associated PAP2 superfamily phosphatase
VLPGGHSSSGFALVAVYFLMLGRSHKLARLALGGALLLGGVFAFGREARGAHFLSHDLWSAALVWFSCLAVYAVGYRGNVWEGPGRVEARPSPIPPSTRTGCPPAPAGPQAAS